jgi:hypothetical protein
MHPENSRGQALFLAHRCPNRGENGNGKICNALPLVAVNDD